MTHQADDLLSELEEAIRPKPKSFNVTASVSAAYIFIVLANLIARFRNFSFNDPRVTLVLAGLVITPIVGLIFFLRGKTVGWIISFFYYQFIGLIVVLAFANVLFTANSERLFDTGNLVIYAMVFTSLVVIYFLYSKGIREYFNIDKIKLGYLIFAACILIVVLFVIVGIASMSDAHK